MANVELQLNLNIIKKTVVCQGKTPPCHLQIKTALFLMDFHFKSALLILSYP
jgi:hypothetical protein